MIKKLISLKNLIIEFYIQISAHSKSCGQTPNPWDFLYLFCFHCLFVILFLTFQFLYRIIMLIFLLHIVSIFLYDQCVILLSTANRHSKPVQAYLKEVFLFLIYYNIIFRSSAPDRKCWMISAAARSSIISISPGILPVSRSFWISAVVQRVSKCSMTHSSRKS